jgi:hypothetical protein
LLVFTLAPAAQQAEYSSHLPVMLGSSQAWRQRTS